MKISLQSVGSLTNEHHTNYYVLAPDCPVDRTTIFVNPKSEGKESVMIPTPTIVFEISNRVV